MSEDDDKAVNAARLYAEDATFQSIADKLETSKSHAQVLVRRGIALLESEKIEPSELIDDNPGTHSDLETYPHQNQYVFPPQDHRSGSYILETSGIGRRVLLTPKDIMIFDLWKGAGFQGDLSDFISDSINFMYEARRPRERMNY